MANKQELVSELLNGPILNLPNREGVEKSSFQIATTRFEKSGKCPNRAFQKTFAESGLMTRTILQLYPKWRPEIEHFVGSSSGLITNVFRL